MAVLKINNPRSKRVSDGAATENRKGGNKNPRQLHKAAILAISTLFLLAMPSAFSHTSMISSSPTQGEVLKSLPERIELNFDSPLMKIGKKEVNQLLMRGPDKALISLTPVITFKSSISAIVTGKDRGEGLYKIYYRVVSQDGHPISGFISYTIGASDLSKVSGANYEKKSWISEFIHHHTIHIWWTLIALAAIIVWAIIRRRGNR